VNSLLPILDLHVHSIHSDGAMTVEEILEVANRKGYLVGIADHASPEDKIIHDAHLVSYLDHLERYPVFRSIELDVELGTDLSPTCLDKLDYVIVGVHFLTLDRLQTFFWDPLALIPDPESFVEAYIATSAAAMGRMHMDIFAHPTLLPISLRSDSARLWTPSRVRRLVAAAVENQVALEISGHWQVPSEELLREGLRQGATFSLGSDGHGPDSMCDLVYPLEMVRRLSIGPNRIFAPRRKLN
jgi:histidinol phosphatase-like PHP family hydrolase